LLPGLIWIGIEPRQRFGGEHAMVLRLGRLNGFILCPNDAAKAGK
jgi:hypothetical protein